MVLRAHRSRTTRRVRRADRIAGDRSPKAGGVRNSAPLRVDLHDGIRGRRRHRQGSESRRKSCCDRGRIPQEYSPGSQGRRPQRNYVLGESGWDGGRRRRSQHRRRPESREEDCGRPWRHDLPRTAEQQARSSRLHVRPHGLGRARDAGSEFARTSNSFTTSTTCRSWKAI